MYNKRTKKNKKQELAGTPVKPVEERKQKMEMNLQLVKKLFEEKKAAAAAEREQERKNSVPQVLNPQGLTMTVFGFFEAEADSYLAVGGTARYKISNGQMYYLKWYNDQYPTTELTSLIKEAEENPYCIYNWENLSILMSELIEDHNSSQNLMGAKQDLSLDSVTAHIRNRI